MTILRFNVFTFDVVASELRKNGHPVKLQPQPTALLALLARHAGGIVSREEIQKELWPDGTVVDYDQSINFCIRRIREVLGDDAEQPRFVETVPRRGYRFVAPVATESKPQPANRRWMILAGFAGIAVLVAALGRRPPSDDALVPVAVPFTSELGDEEMPDFSPDGRQIAYVWNGGGDGFYHVYVKMVTGGEPLQITSDEASDYVPSWSPDGTQIAFLRDVERRARPRPAGGAFEVLLVPALGGTERLVATSSWMTRPDWHPDGKHLAFGSDTGLELLTLSSGERRMLTVPGDRAYDRGIAFSPDGKEVAFFRELYGAGSIGDIYVQPTEGGSARRLTPVYRPIQGFAWTPDGRAIVFSAPNRMDRLGFTTLWRVETSGGAPVRLGFGDNAGIVAVSSDGNLAYDVRTPDLNIWRVSGPAAIAPSPPERLLASTRDDMFPAYSPDGTKIAFLSNRTGQLQLWIARASGDEPRPVGGPAGPAPPTWSPDGDAIAYSAGIDPDGAGVFVVSVRGGPSRHVTPNERMAFFPAWSPDGTWLFYQTEGHNDRWRIAKVSVAGGDALAVIDGFSRGPITSRNRLFYLKPGSIVWSEPIDGDGAAELVLDQHVNILRWTVWNEKIVYIADDRPVVELFDPGTGETHHVTSLGDSPNLGDGFTVSPDGKWILYVQDDAPTGRDIVLVENFDP